MKYLRRMSLLLVLFLAGMMLLVFWPGRYVVEAASQEIIGPQLVEDQQAGAMLEIRLANVPTEVVTPVNTIDLSLMMPPSPDSSGLAYLPVSGTLLIADSEVNELDIFTGDNLFETTLSGQLSSTFTTLPDLPNEFFSDEPSGVAYNPTNDHLFFTDDDGDFRGIYELNPGLDGTYNTTDDIVSEITVTLPITASDLKGVAFDNIQDHLFAVDEDGEEVYEIDPGANGIFEGVNSDDIITNFDVASLGISDPEGIEFNPDNGHLYILSSINDLIAETLTDGTLLRYLDISPLKAVNPSGLAYAPSSTNPTEKHLYIVERGIDNGTDPNENDGKMHEIAFNVAMPPSVDAGSDQVIVLPDNATLNGVANDDGLPIPPGMLTITWSVVSGPGTVTFTNTSTPTTTAAFSDYGSYILRLTAEDGLATISDDVHIKVLGPSGEFPLNIRVDAKSDDAKEVVSTGEVKTNSRPLHLIKENSTTSYTVGIRFNNITLPKAATIISASLQFTAHEANSPETHLTIHGEAIDDALTFSAINYNITTRPRTSATVDWKPKPWLAVGDVLTAQLTYDFSPVIQEIVDRDGWERGNSLAIIITGTDGSKRIAKSFNDGETVAPLLQLIYIDNRPPVVDAGIDQNITLPDNALLNGSVMDDSLPTSPGVVATTWSMVSGPGVVTFGDPTMLMTMADFSAAGIYVLRLTANDGELTTNDEITVIVESVPTAVAPQVNIIITGSNNIELSWPHISLNEKYEVWRSNTPNFSPGSLESEKIAEIENPTLLNVYTDTDVSPEQNVYYIIRAIIGNSNADSDKIEIISIRQDQNEQVGYSKGYPHASRKKRYP